MIIGLILKHIKTYYDYSFIRLHHELPNNFTILTGKNGVGKSTVLEALDVFFNDKEWIVSKHPDVRNHDARIAPVFLVKKSRLNSILSPKSIKYLEEVSKFFWNLEASKQSNLKNEPFTSFFEYFSKMKAEYSHEDYYLFWLGKNYGKKEIEFSGVDSLLEDYLKTKQQTLSFKEKDFKEFIKELFSAFSMVYIPVEIPVYEFLKLEKKSLQDMANKDIFSEIEKILKNQKVQVEQQQIPIIDFINQNLNSFIDDLSSKLNEYAPGYVFDTDENGKKNLTTNDIKEKILEKYFSIRKLRKDKKPIENLSSGEKRKALIDIAQAFLNDEDKSRKNKIIFFALDEPESSLDDSSSFEYFDRLVQISYSTQTIVTSHWYGALPTLQKGSLLYIEKNDEKTTPNISTFMLENFTGERKKLPDLFSFKSYFDLASSIISSMREKEVNWLIVEGTSDKNYLSHYLKKEIQNLKIIPLGGGQSVISLYNYLHFPLSQTQEADQLKGRILCLIDTDEKIAHFTANKLENNCMQIVRLQQKKKDVYLEKNITSGEHIQTEIEDVMPAKKMYDALINLSQKMSYENEDLKVALDFFKVKENDGYSFFNGDDFFLIPKATKAGYQEVLDHKNTIKTFISNNYNKELLSRAFAQSTLNNKPVWMEKIIGFFSNGKIA